MKPYLPALFLVLIFTVVVISSSPSSSGDEPETFEEGSFVYRVVEDGVSIQEYLGEDEEVLDIPDSVIHDGKEYIITVFDADIWEDCVEVINFGPNIRSISEYSFQGVNIREINVSEDNWYYSSMEGVLFNKYRNTLIKFPVAKESELYFVPSSVSYISPSSFEYSKNLEEVVLNDGLVRIGRWAFGNCHALEHVSSSQGTDVFPVTVAMIGDSAFYKCDRLNSFSLPDDLEVIGSAAFEFGGMTEVSLPYNLTTVGERAFSNCMNLTRFIFPYGSGGMFFVHDGVLYRNGLSDLELMIYPAAKSDEVYRLHDEATKISPGAFSGCLNLKEVILNNNIATIDLAAFEDCHSLTTIDLGNILSINTSAFDGCENLCDVKFGKNLYYIGNSAFNRSGIEKVIMGDNLAAMGYDAFSNCLNLKEVTISPKCSVVVPYNTFYCDLNLKTINVEGYNATFEEESLSIGISEENTVILDVYVKEGYSLPSDVADDFTIINIIEEGKGPYPYENWVGVFFCVLLIIGILMFVREV